MNREQRRKGMKDINDLPCNLSEVIRIAKSVSEDSLKDYHNTLSPMLISVSLQLEMLKSVLFDANVISEEEYNEKFSMKVDEFNKDREKILEELSSTMNKEANADASFNAKSGPTVVEFTKKGE